jgi:hypothetical protein
MTIDPRLRAVLTVLLTALVIAAAALLWHNLPDMMDVEGPFDIDGTVGEQVSDRALSVTVTGVRLGSQLRAPSRPPVKATGEWLVVDAELSGANDPVLPLVELRIGPNTYVRTDRFRPTQLGTELAPGIPQRGSWAFDVAPQLIGGSEPVSLRLWHDDGRLDSRLVVRIPRDDIDRVDEPIMLESVEVGA